MTAEDITRAAPPGDPDDLTAAGQVPGDGPGTEEEGPTDAAMREELRARGHNPPARGRLGADWVSLWESREGAESAQVAADVVGDDGAVSAADFTRPHDDQVETTPKRPKAEGWRARLGVAGTGKGKRRSGKEKTGARQAAPKHARVPLDRLGESAFDLLARITRGPDPVLSRTFALEAPLAGPMIEEALAGTLVDKVAQPLARAQAKTRILTALFGMPLGILALEQAQTLPEKQRLTREALIVPMLRECAVMWIEYAGPAIQRKMERDAERGPLYEEADELLRFLLYGPAADPGPGDGQAWAGGEDQAAADAQKQATPGFMGFAAGPPQPAYAHPYPPANPAAQLVPRPR